MVILKEFFEKLILKKKQTTKKHEKYPVSRVKEEGCLKFESVQISQVREYYFSIIHIQSGTSYTVHMHCQTILSHFNIKYVFVCF